MALPKRIRIREVGPREGFQTMRDPIPTEKKLDLISALGETGVSDIEITSFVKPDKVPQMADASEVVARYTRHPGIRYTALYLNQKGFELGEESKRLDNSGWLYLAVSETFLKKNSNTTIQQSLDEIPSWIRMFEKAGKPLEGLMLSTAFGCSYEGKIPTAKVLEVIQKACDASKGGGTDLPEVCLADTMGWGTPELVKEIVRGVRKQHPKIRISLHLHDTRGAGLANVYAGLEEGIDIFDGSVGGLGGCPFAIGAAGNVATEDLVFLCEDMGVSTGVDIDKYVEAAKLAENIFGTPLPGKLYKVWKK